MIKILTTLLSLVLLYVLPSSLHARGGGGCLIQGTPVLTPSGPIAIDKLKQGDVVLGVLNACSLPVIVESVLQVHPDKYFEIIINGRGLFVTAEHPVGTQAGVFRIASSLKPGDHVLLHTQQGLQSRLVETVRTVAATAPAYNLLVSPAGTYIAGNIIVHNKGCFLPETLIKLADGSEKPISQIQRHDRLLAFTLEGAVVQATVRRVLIHEVDEYLVVKTLDRVFNVTAEHPFYTGSGTFKTLEALKIGDEIIVFDGTGLSSRKIESTEAVHAKTVVYNLQTDKPNTFFANGAAVHNKGGGGGCFPAGTLIKTPRGDIPIERIVKGITIISIDKSGKAVLTQVKETHATRSSLLTLSTDRGPLITTEEHPIARSSGGFVPALELTPSDKVLTWEGNSLIKATIISTTVTNTQAEVYTITVDRPHTFVANGFIVHNKGGGGFRSGGGYHSSGPSSGKSIAPSFFDYVIIFFIIFGVIYFIIDGIRKGPQSDLDFIFKQSDISQKQEKTVKLLSFISKQDVSVEPGALTKLVQSTFLKLQKCWQSREYTPMQPLLMPDLYKEHLGQIQGMIRNHEINMLDKLRIERVDLVNIRYTIKEDQREFTALITAGAIDYYLDDRTRARLRGDTNPAQFQEFWTFQYVHESWLLRDIEQTRESDVLKEDNFFEQVTDKGVDQIYGEEAGQEGPAGPWLEKKVEAKDTRIGRMLNFLVKTDKLWNRKTMLLTARRTFLSVMAAWETGDPVSIPSAELFPDMADDLKKTIAKNRETGTKYEYRNLCIRKVELLLVRNFNDNSKDEFIARIRAHAQKILRKQDSVIHQDEYVTPFEQFLTFGRLDNQWKLKEIVNTDDAEGLAVLENVDQESSPLQLQWYYQHKRVS